MKFIDLFAGLGGFHIALSNLGHECVFASEIDENLQNLYEMNFGLRPEGDIRNVSVNKIPQHDILCAGFPCQPFSKAGDQKGLECPVWGDLIQYVIQILDFHSPQFFILENVPNIQHHDSGKTWQNILQSLQKASTGYDISYSILSPHDFGIPQIRRRIFIVGSKSNLNQFSWPKPKSETISIHSVLDTTPDKAKPLSQQASECLAVWQEFLDLYPVDQSLPSFPIWSMEFGATYPFQNTTPYNLDSEYLAKYRGNHGTRLASLTPEEIRHVLPSYALSKQRKFPSWKERYIKQNRELYLSNKSWLDKWIPKILRFPPSLQKFEWNCKGEERDLSKYIIQFRASGVRVKRPTTAPSLVAMTTTQVPVVAWEKRYMTVRECARLQSVDRLSYLPEAETRAFKALGNAVNATVVENIANALITSCAERLKNKPPLN